ncbi:MAG: formylglycine-generating enzyme family protein, partial [Gammaproteobacteria bacterium]|nr:formylglycine-generating enzyme family protein [Gammaproteobacteria bacterium]
PTCPRMVVIPPGRFAMGSWGGEVERYEGPVRNVTIDYTFAVGQYEITNDQFAEFIAATGHTPADYCNLLFVDELEVRTVPGMNWRDPRYGRPPAGDEPVVCVRQTDALAYTQWLAAQTGKDYRLLTEAEWEYTALAGSDFAFPWGPDLESACAHGNVYDQSALDERLPIPAPNCDDGSPGVSPVGQYQPNAFGVYDMVGNVWEWLSDCYVVPYPDEPTDGSAVMRAGCERWVSKGGSWRSSILRQRPAFRGRDPADLSTQIFGFRVARSLGEPDPS